MSIFFDISNSQSSKLWSTVQMWSSFDGLDYIGIFHIKIALTSPCTLKTVQVLFDPTVVGPWDRIWRLRSVSLFSVLFLSIFRSNGPRSVGNFGWDPMIRNASRAFDHFFNVALPSIIRSSWTYLLFACWSLVLYSSHHYYCTCHQWQAYASCKKHLPTISPFGIDGN